MSDKKNKWNKKAHKSKKKAIKDILMYTDFTFPTEQQMIVAYRYYRFGPGVVLDEASWRNLGSLATLTIRSEVQPPLQ